MKRLHITAEGQTEESFVNKTLKQHLAQFGVYADVRCVLTGKKKAKTFRGGMTTYEKAKKDISRWLREETSNLAILNLSTKGQRQHHPSVLSRYSPITRTTNQQSGRW